MSLRTVESFARSDYQRGAWRTRGEPCRGNPRRYISGQQWLSTLVSVWSLQPQFKSSGGNDMNRLWPSLSCYRILFSANYRFWLGDSIPLIHIGLLERESQKVFIAFFGIREKSAPFAIF